jgi:hypothetical protein
MRGAHSRAWDLNKRDEANRGLEQLSRMNVEAGWVLFQMTASEKVCGRTPAKEG